jgi:hypothetical protein
VIGKTGKKRERSAACWKQIIRWLRLWLPSLDKEGKSGPEATAGVVRTVAEKPNQ